MKELDIQITEENYQRAITAHSGACLVADAIKEKYPQFSDIKVNVASVRVTDRKAGQRYIYLTPPSVSDTLLFFDQGWPEKTLPKRLRIRDLVRVTQLTRSASAVKSDTENRAKRLAELEAKVQTTELTSDEKRTLTRLQKPYNPPVRPTKPDKPIAEGNDEQLVIYGGYESRRDSRRNPNLLAGRTRHFGRKNAQPSQVFKQAVKEAVLADRKKRRPRTKEIPPA
jgi:hypothetical protein